MSSASPSRAEPSSSSAARLARSKCAPSGPRARMLCESSSTSANATEAPELRARDSREQRTKGVAPITAKQRIASPRSSSSSRSSMVARSRATERAAGTRRGGRKRRAHAIDRTRSKCAAIRDDPTNRPTPSAAATRKLTPDLRARRNHVSRRFLPGRRRLTRLDEQQAIAREGTAADQFALAPASAARYCGRAVAASVSTRASPSSARRCTGPVNGKLSSTGSSTRSAIRVLPRTPSALIASCAVSGAQIWQITQHDHARAAQRAPFDTGHSALQRAQIRAQVRARLRGFERANDALERLPTARGGELHGAFAAKPVERHAVACADRDFRERGRDQRGECVFGGWRALAAEAHRGAGVDQQAQRAVCFGLELPHEQLAMAQ